MAGNYFKTGLRTIRRQKGYALLNIAGLAVGIACVLFIGLYVRDELSFDRFWPNADRIFRIVTERREGAIVDRYAGTQVPFGPALRLDFPEIRRVARFWNAEREIVRFENRVFEEETGFYFADPDALTMFGFPLRSGDPATALAGPNGIALTESAARKYFGAVDPLGRTLVVNGYPVKNAVFTVTAVLKDLPGNSQFDFQFLASVKGVTTEIGNWGSTKPIWTYVELPPGVPAASIEARLAAFVDKHLKSRDGRIDWTMSLEPLRRVHLTSVYNGGFKPRGDISAVILFAAIGLFILLVACMNFINLATALSFTRAKEVGVRKVLGANRGGLVRQFLVEAFLLSAFSLVLAFGLLGTFLPALNALAGKSLSLDASNAVFVVLLSAAVMVGVGLLAGAYPAVFLSRFRPLAILRGRFASSSHGARLRKALVVFQFAVSTVLLVGTAVTGRQMAFIRHKNLGLTADPVLVVPYSPAASSIRSLLLQNPRVIEASVSERVPVNRENGDTRGTSVDGRAESPQLESFVVDTHFLDTYGLRLLAGRPLPERFPGGDTPFLINETAVRKFGWASPDQALGASIRWSGGYKKGHIIGVVNDFHMDSLREPIGPAVFLSIPDDPWWCAFLSIRIRPEDLKGTMALVRETWTRLTPEGAYREFFIDESLARLHREDQRLGAVVSIFAGLSVLIACLGLFGLGTYAVQQRRREIGIRKVLGASAPRLVTLLSKEFLGLALIADLLAWPLGYLAMKEWLEGFAYRIDIGIGSFLAAGALALVVAFAAVFYQAIQAALSNPVKALRVE